MTERLLIEAKKNNMNFCVLHDSFMVESTYRKLGAESNVELIYPLLFIPNILIISTNNYMYHTTFRQA